MQSKFIEDRQPSILIIWSYSLSKIETSSTLELQGGSSRFSYKGACTERAVIGDCDLPLAESSCCAEHSVLPRLTCEYSTL